MSDQNGNDRGLCHIRIDRHGVIQSGDLSFVALSGLDPARLTGAPHDVTLHPDMPRAILWQAWRTLEKDGIAATYLRHLCADGKDFWTLTVIVSLDADYTAVLSAPRSPLADTMAAACARLPKELRADTTGAPLDAIDAELAAAGHRTRLSFMSDAMSAEVAGLPDAGPVGQRRRKLLAIRRKLIHLQAMQDALAATFRTLHLIPTNLRIIASRLEPSGGPISAISDRYKHDSADLMARLADRPDKRGGRAAPVIAELDELLIHDGAIRLLSAAADRIENDPGFGHHSGLATARLLRDYCARPVAQGSLLSTYELQLRLYAVRHEAETLLRLMAGLEQVRILGEVECSRLRGADQGLQAVLSQLRGFHDAVRSGITPMMSALRQIDPSF